MLGWEFPPYFAGGVGMVCYELTKELASQGINIDYLMPRMPLKLSQHIVHLLDASKLEPRVSIQRVSPRIRKLGVTSFLQAYQTKESYQKTKELLQAMQQKERFFGTGANTSGSTNSLYGENLLDEVKLFAQRTKKVLETRLSLQKISKKRASSYSVIHAHDWTTIPAAIQAKKILRKPLIVHVHITEFNKNPGHGIHKDIYEVEREGFMQADKIIAVSNAIKQTLIDQYGVNGEKIEVVHNGGVNMAPVQKRVHQLTADGSKIVSFMGRITAMKGPQHFVEMAKKVLEKCPKTKFIVAGTGDKLQECISKTNDMGIAEKFYFHGFYTREEAELLYDLSDVFVLPSLMEPFGVTPLEAMQKNTPVIVSKQSGVSEAIRHCFKVDFWDVDKMASHVVGLLTYPLLHKALTREGYKEAKAMDWNTPAKECVSIYEKLSKKTSKNIPLKSATSVAHQRGEVSE
ncbi:MAG: glycosyltransferase [Candidatus Nanoarchaeia archaeon]